MEHIEKMVDSFLRLLLYKKSQPNTNVAGDHITKLCKRSFSSKEQGQVKEVKELKTEIDSASYALGLDMAIKVKANFEEANKELFLQGV